MKELIALGESEKAVLDALTARDEAEQEHARRIADAVEAIANIENMGDRVKAVLAVYDRVPGYKIKLAKCIGLSPTRVRFLMKGPHTIECLACGSAITATPANFEQKEYVCDPCVDALNATRNYSVALRATIFKRTGRDIYPLWGDPPDLKWAMKERK